MKGIDLVQVGERARLAEPAVVLRDAKRRTAGVELMVPRAPNRLEPG
jgi:hypothetical protein